jgi:hypothetical protein
VEIRSGSIRQFQFPEYSDLRRGVKQRLHKGADQNQVSASERVWQSNRGFVWRAILASEGAHLEHFQERWNPVFGPKM